MQLNKFLFLFLLLAIINIAMEYWQIKWGVFLTKPLLMTILSFYFFKTTLSNPSSFRTYLFGGLIFSILGDTFLMFVEHNPDIPQFFIFGLGSFLITHLLYLMAFAKIGKVLKKGFVVKNKGWVLLFAAFFIGNIVFLWPAIPPELKTPVTIYSLAIITMAAFGLNLKGIIPRQLFVGLMSGILLFVISDSLIAINKFHPNDWHIPLARVFIMVTYLTAQYLIVTKSVQVAKNIKA